MNFPTVGVAFDRDLEFTESPNPFGSASAAR